jgi:hypothetical protein
VFVDTKFEFGYVTDKHGHEKLIYMDEVGTPDSSRIWDGPSYRAGEVIEKSKEEFRQQLLELFPGSGHPAQQGSHARARCAGTRQRAAGRDTCCRSPARIWILPRRLWARPSNCQTTQDRKFWTSFAETTT